MSSTRTVVLPLALLLCGCRAEAPVENITIKDGDTLVKHCYATSVKDGWMAEAWLEGTAQTGGYPVNVWVRLRLLEDGKVPLPKAKVQLMIQERKGKVTRNA